MESISAFVLENCNNNSCCKDNLLLNPEHKPNCSCGCDSSYNGGAGAGTADCCSCIEKRHDVHENKYCSLDESCCSEYQGELKNKKPGPCCPREFDPEKLIFGHKMGAEHHKKLKIELGADHNCCETIYEQKHLGSSCPNVKTCSGCPDMGSREPGCCGGIYETELVNKKPNCSVWPDDCCACQNNFLARKH